MIEPMQLDEVQPFASPPQPERSSELGQEDFLTLMITQFRNQDPFEPMDNGQFLGQLAQFSTVSGIESLNGAFEGLAAALRDEQALQASNLVGRSVLADTDTAYFDGEAVVGGAVNLDSAATNVQVDIVDMSGQLVHRVELGEQAAGTVQFDWDGRDNDGELVEPGHYQISSRVIRGTNIESAPSYVRADVQSVTLGQFGGGMTLNLAGGDSLSLSQVYQII